MTVITKHSTYRVSPMGGHFEVVKLSGSKTSGPKIGDVYQIRSVEMAVGGRLYFDGWMTSAIQEVLA